MIDPPLLLVFHAWGIETASTGQAQKARVTLRVCRRGSLQSLDFMVMGQAGVLWGQLHKTADRWEGCLSFPTLLRSHLIPPQMNHLPESQILLWEYGARLVFQDRSSEVLLQNLPT